ncbi:MAG: FixH family protein [bacterium]
MRWLWLAAALLLVACGQRASAKVEGDGWVATLEWSPRGLKALRPAQLVLRVQDRSGRPVDLLGLQAQADMPEMSHEPDPVRFRRTSEGTYEASHNFSMDGLWRVRVRGRWDGGAVEATFHLTVGGP